MQKSQKVCLVAPSIIEAENCLYIGKLIVHGGWILALIPESKKLIQRVGQGHKWLLSDIVFSFLLRFSGRTKTMNDDHSLIKQTMKYEKRGLQCRKSFVTGDEGPALEHSLDTAELQVVPLRY